MGNLALAFTIVDTDILIDVARGDSDAIDCLRRLEKTSPLAVSAVTQMELIVGSRNKKELQDLENFFPPLRNVENHWPNIRPRRRLNCNSIF